MFLLEPRYTWNCTTSDSGGTFLKQFELAVLSLNSTIHTSELILLLAQSVTVASKKAASSSAQPTLLQAFHCLQ